MFWNKIKQLIIILKNLGYAWHEGVIGIYWKTNLIELEMFEKVNSKIGRNSHEKGSAKLLNPKESIDVDF